MKFLFSILCALVFSTATCFSQDIFDKDIKPAAESPELYLPLVKGKRVALVINQTSMVGNKSLLDVLLEKKVRVTRIFVPEHGFRGQEDAGAHVDNSVDKATGIPVVSLYGKHKQPTAADLADVDVLVYDLQDVGVRFYTYISTMEYCMEACADNHKEFIILDRPNPNGFYVDGPVLEKEHRSFVGMQRVPIVYGMTVGEYAMMVRGERWGLKEDMSRGGRPKSWAKPKSPYVKVIKCTNYTHSKKYKLPVAPSPNLRTMAAVYAYPSLCLFEGTKVSVGRGTDLPFQQYGCPELESTHKYSFTPQSMPGAKKPPFEGKKCYGMLIGTTPEEVLQKVENKFRVKWLIYAYYAYPERDKFFTDFFTQLSGTTNLRKLIEESDDEELIRASWQKDVAAFKKIRKKYLLYPDFE